MILTESELRNGMTNRTVDGYPNRSDVGSQSSGLRIIVAIFASILVFAAVTPTAEAKFNILADPVAILDSTGAINVFANSSRFGSFMLWQGEDGHWYFAKLMVQEKRLVFASVFGTPALVLDSSGKLHIIGNQCSAGAFCLSRLIQTNPGMDSWSDGFGTPAFHIGSLPSKLSHPASDPAVVINNSGRIDVFARGSDDALWHTSSSYPDGSWTDWHSLGGKLQGKPSAAVNLDGVINVYAIGLDGALWHSRQIGTDDFLTLESLGGSLKGSPMVIPRTPGGVLECFATGSDGAIWHSLAEPGARVTSLMGGNIQGDPVVMDDLSGNIELFARGNDDAVWTSSTIGPPVTGDAPANWSSWKSLGGNIRGNPTVVTDKRDNRLGVIARDVNGNLVYTYRDAATYSGDSFGNLKWLSSWITPE